jgi:SpoIIAA-like
MVQHELLRDKGVLIIKPDGPLGERDFQSIAGEIDPYIEANGKLSGIIIRADFFPGWDSLAAFFSHMRFIGDHHRKIGRIAVLTDSAFLKTFPPLAAAFLQPEIKPFGLDQQNEALNWIEGSS